ncbi:hypothetical protein TWF569_005554 [Orbilia oligospora]|uniref:C2H2-type domain-containing protein n=1 Tax=Orbilia oligospora TaxID=2813651 RepID=A0A7C8NHT8_ORBOL|nr:hypothetical protein TWF102_011440 [Orbilia oligospora]KAF3118026.1 hypothetical protein TWF103_000063 [Orbilia oligospora]KAF3156570.1 hypothetical protein TWF569_005554 [Orbilia oligospora]
MLIKEAENSFTAAESCSGASYITSVGKKDIMDTGTSEPKGKERAIDAEEVFDVEDDEDLVPIVIDGGCLCSLLRYQVNLSVEFQKTELYKELVGFAHCYCHSCKCAVSGLTRTSLKFPREMVQWTSRAKLVEPEPESPASSIGRRRGSKSASNAPAPIAEANESTSKKSSEGGSSTSGSQPNELPEKVTKRAARLQSTLEAVKQDPEFDTEFADVDNATGCCCYEEDNVDEIQTPKSPVWGPSKKPSLGMTAWSGNAGYHRRIWKRERGVGGKPSASGEASPITNASVSPAPSISKDPSTSLKSGKPQSSVEQPDSTKSKGKGKPKAKEGLWTKMKGKASAAISSKEKDRTTGKERVVVSIPPTNEDLDIPASQSNTSKTELGQKICQLPEKTGTSTGCDIISPPANPPQPSSLEILRWETQLLHQQESDLSHGPCTSQGDTEDFDGDPQNNTLPIPWPYREFAVTTRDGRTSYRGFCSWCGGSLTYRTSATIHGMVDIHAGSMDDPEKALRQIGFLREVHIETAGGVEEGARLGTMVGHWRDGTVSSYDSCDMERRLYFDSDGEEGAHGPGNHGEAHDDGVNANEEP